MKNPYQVLGVPETASEEQIKSAYRELAKKYHPDNYANSDLADLATEKMKEINEAYDAITSGSYAKERSRGSAYGSGQYYYSAEAASPEYAAIRTAIQRRRYDEADSLLNNIPNSDRGAEWNFLKGQVCYNRGRFDEAASYFTAAYNMDPNNPEYRRAYANMSNAGSGGFRTQRSDDSTGGFCSMCQGLLCADCCCECMGGDLIPCC